MADRWDQPRIVFLKDYSDNRGILTAVEGLPFAAKRAFWIYCVPDTEWRGGHAHKFCKQFIVPVKGECRITVRGAKMNYRFIMNRPNKGLFVPELYEVRMSYFSNDCVLLVLASHEYDKDDYITYKEII